jgi:hypothetical protein
MDYYCTKLGRLLDNGLDPLVYPDTHSIHCLVDVGVCVNSEFEVLTPTSSGGDKLYQRSWRLLEGDGKQLVIDLARSVGDPAHYCSTCTPEGKEKVGFRATMKVTLVELASGDVPPIVEVEEAFSSRTVVGDAVTLVDDSPCQHYFNMDDATTLQAGTTTTTTTTTTVDSTTSVPSPAPSTFPSDAPSTFPSDVPSMSPSSIPTPVVLKSKVASATISDESETESDDDNTADGRTMDSGAVANVVIVTVGTMIMVVSFIIVVLSI